MSKYKSQLLIFILFLGVFTCASLVSAQEMVEYENVKKDKNAPNLSLGNEFTLDSEKDIEELMKNTPMIDSESTIVEDKYKDSYKVSSIQNLSRLYVKMNVLDIKDTNILDNFLKINECSLFKRFNKDDLEWERVRKAAEEMIKDNKEVYSAKIKSQMPIDLGKYDVEKQGFPIINNTKFDNIRRINIEDKTAYANTAGDKLDYDKNRDCIQNRLLEGYPRTILLILDKPISYDFVKVDEHLAQAFLIRRNNSKNHFTDTGLRDYDRPAFARLRVTISKFGGPTENEYKGYQHDKKIYMFFGYLDGIDVFEDPKENRLISSMDFPKSKQRLKEEEREKKRRVELDLLKKKSNTSKE